ncbi:MAG: phosphopantetheine-binding protein, partial [Stenotrophomonas indicatrix]|jgi:acyl carrier protein|uniref:phosphopantetheine-binding protein n=1 Tax=Stenotrophomonas indicatrix TaxID=2045451 RepID=UPI003D0E6CE4
MVPTQVIVLEALPLTANGKIDRRALPDLVWDVGTTEERELLTATQQRLATIWGELLGSQDIGRNAGFFDVGGNSLRATQLSVRIAEAFGVRVGVRDIFLHPRLAALAEHIDALVWMQASPPTGNAGLEQETHMEMGLL